MAIKNYMINDKWLDIAKQNIVEVESTDGVIGSVKVNGQEYGGGGGSSDLTWILPEQTVTLVDQPVEITGLRLDLIPQDTGVVPIKLIYELAGNLHATYVALRYLNGVLSDDDGVISIYPQDNSYYFVYSDGESISAGEYTISIALF